MKIERVWAMPSLHTFTIKPIAMLLEEEMSFALLPLWVDPFAGYNSKAQIKNDINQEIPADDHRDALEFLKGIRSEYADGVLYDPPYSITQAARYGTGFSSKAYWSACKKEIARIVKPGGKVISFGWNSGGIGKTNGMSLERILLVNHGGNRNDTIVTVEVKPTTTEEG